MIRKVVKAVLAISLIGIVGCITLPLSKEEKYDILLTNKKVPLDQISTMIKAGCKDRDWICTDKEPGKIEALLNNRGHIVRLNILYNADALTFIYISSKNMKEDGSSIHRKYYNWLDNLVSSIQERINKANL